MSANQQYPPPQGNYPPQQEGYPPPNYQPQDYQQQNIQQQGYPSQGYPPQGYPPQGYPQAGYAGGSAPQPGSFPPTNILHVYYEMPKASRLIVSDDSKTTTVYTADIHMRKPNLVIKSAMTDTIEGTASYHLMSTRIDLTVRDQPLELASEGLLKRTYKYKSPGFGGSELSWKPISKLDELKLELLDSNKTVIARFEPTNWSLKKSGKIELLPPCMGNKALVDEIIVSLLALMYYRHTQRMSALAAV